MREVWKDKSTNYVGEHYSGREKSFPDLDYRPRHINIASRYPEFWAVVGEYTGKRRSGWLADKKTRIEPYCPKHTRLTHNLDVIA